MGQQGEDTEGGAQLLPELWCFPVAPGELCNLEQLAGPLHALCQEGTEMESTGAVGVGLVGGRAGTSPPGLPFPQVRALPSQAEGSQLASHRPRPTTGLTPRACGASF